MSPSLQSFRIANEHNIEAENNVICLLRLLVFEYLYGICTVWKNFYYAKMLMCNRVRPDMKICGVIKYRSAAASSGPFRC